MFCNYTIILLLIQSYIKLCLSFLEPGIWSYDIVKNEQYIAISKILYKDSTLYATVLCHNVSFKMKVSWVLRLSPCGDEYSYIADKNDLIGTYFISPQSKPLQFSYRTIEFQLSKNYNQDPILPFTLCENGYFHFEDESYMKHEVFGVEENKNIGSQIITSYKNALNNYRVNYGQTKIVDDPISFNRYNTTSHTPVDYNSKNIDIKNDQDVEAIDILPKNITKPIPPLINPRARSRRKNSSLIRKRSLLKFENPEGVISKTWKTGNYLLILKFEVEPDDENVKISKYATVRVEMKSSSGKYLSAHDWPMLPFYACMCALYLIYMIVWSFWCIYYYKELLRIQYCIAAVIFLGFLEKSLFLGEYHTVNSTGNSIYGALVFAELISALKRALSRILIIIACIGYGIVKPRLGSTMKRVIYLGFVYFIFAWIDGILRVSKNKANPNSIIIFATIPVAFLDSVICWWVFSGLVNTLRTLKLRHNVVKLTMYRYFTNVLVFCVIASIAFMLWSFKEHKLITCLKNWRQIWLDEAFWHLLFSLILFAIIILWRPSANNQRYAFSPLLDANSDDEINGIVEDLEEDEENELYSAKGVVKMRSFTSEDRRPLVSHKSNSNHAKNTTEDDLKWIEDNIPPLIADTALPNILDSEEEENIRRFEIGKMQ
ncbi:transmembrane protein 87A-like isoform X2 [Gordionus sp. m RMFG-2023]|uniref:transmembrane protein 87A-like isoform X2 n=1 Tax=Gordionus sp. m RMFG-2023 TaxID=3053472 RepID=UPI0031FE1AE7